MDHQTLEQVKKLLENVERVVFGKYEVVKLCIVGLLSRGHILIEDIPGIGKTTIAQAIARSLDCSFCRIQFTSDMLPSDILGVSVLDPKTQDFKFRRGAIFANVVLADEINRTPPKTQSALIEAMSENQVSVDGKTYPLPKPFIVMATQNPIEYEGTYTLPESQLDRFILRVEIGYPPTDDELRIMRRRDPLKDLAELRPVLNANDLLHMQDCVGEVHVDESVAHYMLAIIHATRTHEQIQLGASPRGALSFYEACQARALVEGKDFVTPGDVKQMALPVLGHRILIKSRGADLATAARERARVMAEILKTIKAPV
ncbi:MAG TPA: MoxR family ATPase [Candidatus Hydrogenedentes bacterium]|nr:MoxR family ATPase [Candidatus Hydrogenedentota bacterium]